MTVDRWKAYCKIIEDAGAKALERGGTCGIKFEIGVKKVQIDLKDVVKFENDGTAAINIQLTGLYDNPFGPPPEAQ